MSFVSDARGLPDRIDQLVHRKHSYAPLKTLATDFGYFAKLDRRCVRMLQAIAVGGCGGELLTHLCPHLLDASLRSREGQKFLNVFFGRGV